MIQAILFDCFGTIFNMDYVPREDIANYVRQVKAPEWSPLVVPDSFRNLRVHPDVVEGMRRLAITDDINLFAFSNGTHELISHLGKENEIDDLWCVLDLAFVRRYKPRHEAMSFALGAVWMNVPITSLGEIALVTANPTFGDVEMAQAFGVRAIVIRHGYPNDLIELADLLAKERAEDNKPGEVCEEKQGFRGVES